MKDFPLSEWIILMIFVILRVINNAFRLKNESDNDSNYTTEYFEEKC